MAYSSDHASLKTKLFEALRSPDREKGIILYLDIESSHVGQRPFQGRGARLIYLHIQMAAAMIKNLLASHYRKVPDFYVGKLRLSPFDMDSHRVRTWHMGRSRLMQLSCVGHGKVGRYTPCHSSQDLLLRTIHR